MFEPEVWQRLPERKLEYQQVTGINEQFWIRIGDSSLQC